jgi:hypothetical protein
VRQSHGDQEERNDQLVEHRFFAEMWRTVKLANDGWWSGERPLLYTCCSRWFVVTNLGTKQISLQTLDSCVFCASVPSTIFNQTFSALWVVVHDWRILPGWHRHLRGPMNLGRHRLSAKRCLVKFTSVLSTFYSVTYRLKKSISDWIFM